MGDFVLIQKAHGSRGPANRNTVLIDPAAVVGVRIEPMGRKGAVVVLLLPGHEVRLPAHPDGTQPDEFEDAHQALRAAQRLLPERFTRRLTDWMEATRAPQD